MAGQNPLGPVNIDTGALITLAAQAAGIVNSGNQVNSFGIGAIFGINITQVTGTVTLAVTIQGIDKASGKAYTLLASANIAAIGFTQLTICPGITAVANVAANAPMPRGYNVQAVVTGTGTITGTIGASLIQ